MARPAEPAAARACPVRTLPPRNDVPHPAVTAPLDHPNRKLLMPILQTPPCRGPNPTSLPWRCLVEAGTPNLAGGGATHAVSKEKA
ncbi:MAG: hypothetical protein ACP5NP_05225 [Acetobacteraceae bacterium]